MTTTGGARSGRGGPGARSLALLLPVLAVLLGGCVGSGPARAAEQEGFVRCAAQAGIDTDGLDELDRGSQFDFWEQPGAMACAVQELTDAELDGAVRAVFGYSGGDGDEVDVAQAKLRITRVLALDVARSAGEEPALRALERLFGTGVGDGSPTAPARVGAMVVVQVVDGEWEDYREYLRDRGRTDSHDQLLDFFNDRLTKAGRNAEWSRIIDLEDRLLVTVEEGRG